MSLIIHLSWLCVGVSPVMTRTRLEARTAVRAAVSAFVSPGPRVTVQTPSSPVAHACPSAMARAVASWRTPTYSIPTPASSPLNWTVSSPDSPRDPPHAEAAHLARHCAIDGRGHPMSRIDSRHGAVTAGFALSQWTQHVRPRSGTDLDGVLGIRACSVTDDRSAPPGLPNKVHKQVLHDQHRHGSRLAAADKEDRQLRSAQAKLDVLTRGRSYSTFELVG